MTTYNFSDGSTVTSFVVASDKLSFASEISAASVTFTQAGLNLKITAGAQVTTINNLTTAQLLSSNLLFIDGSLYLAGTSSDDSLSGTSVADQLDGGAGNDYLSGNAGNDSLSGGAGNDTLFGGEGADTLVGSTGNDLLSGDTGNDTYVLTKGDGQVTISDGDTTADNIDTVQFLDVESTEVTALERQGDDLLLWYSTADQLHIRSYFSGGAYEIEKLAFSDGVSWDEAAIKARVITHGTTLADRISGYDDGTNRIFGLEGDDYLAGGVLADQLDGGAGNDYLSGNAGNDSLSGGAGNDTLFGGEGADTLLGGAGDDFLSGGAGNDLYVLAKGAGFDTIIDGDATVGNIDTVQFLDVKSTEVTVLERQGNDLVLWCGTADRLSIGGGAGGYKIEKLAFSDGVSWDEAAIKARVIIQGTYGADQISGYDDGTNRIFGLDGDDYLTGGVLADQIDGGAGNDKLVGGKGNDSLTGGTGNDILFGGEGAGMSGGAGNDTYVLAKGAGVDTLIDGDATAGNIDTVQFLDVKSTEVTALERQGDALVLKYGTADQLRISSYFSGGAYKIEMLAFSDGVSWDFGVTANSILYGTLASEVMTGTTGQDNLNGGAGADTLSGGSGADVFYYAVSGNDVDTITDFADNDVIRTVGVNLSGPITAGTGATLAKGQAQLSTSAGVTTLSIGTNAISGADISIRLNGVFSAAQLSAFGTDIAFKHAPTGNVTLSGTARQGQTLTAANTLADIDGLGAIGYQWKADDIAIAGATANTLVLAEAQVGKAITVTASYTDDHNTAESITSSASAAVANVNDAAIGQVSISGTAIQGQNLTAQANLINTDWLGTIRYMWLADWEPIAGANSATLSLGQDQVGKTIVVVAFKIDDFGVLESIQSNSTVKIANINDMPTGSVTITGTVMQGQTLTAGNTLADLDGLGAISYQWSAEGNAIAGATANTLVLGQAQVGKAITVAASYTDAFGQAERVASVATTAVANVNDAPAGTVTITGTAAQDQMLTASNTLTDVDGLGTISYQWSAGGTAIASATSGTLVLGQAQVGKAITVAASYTDGAGALEHQTSGATVIVTNVNDLPTGSVTITGTVTQGQTLTAGNTLADLDGLDAISYQWSAGGTAIAGATASTLVLGQAQVDKAITVAASYTDALGTDERVASAATTAVTNVNDAPTGTVTISGTTTQGQTLTAINTLADIDGLGAISYQWTAGGTAIAGATASTLVLGQAQVGKAITVSANYTDAFSKAESVANAATTAVANLNDLPTGSMTITGTATQGQTLTVANALADLDGLGTVSYQWSAGGSAIAGATASTLVLGQAQVGKAITVAASYTDALGTAERVASSATAAVVTNIPPQVITGTGDGDTLTGGAGNDTFDGGAGTDTAAFSSLLAAYSFAPSSGNKILSGPDGSDTLSSIERLTFADANLAFDLEGNAGQTYRLYQAAFNRTPDIGGLGGWIIGRDSGLTPLQVANSFMASAEFQSLYGANPSNEQFVSLLYTNALHRPADAGSLGYWINQLASGLQTRAQALVNFSESPENKASVLPSIANGILYANATQAAGLAKGQSFTGAAGNDTFLGTVGNDTFNGGAGNDTINGGAGLDVAVYGGTRASHTIVNGAALTVSGGNDGTDMLTNVERLRFDDTALAFDTSGNAGQTYRLYQAAFNRTPDKGGLSDWIRGMDTGMSLQKVANGFIGSAEFKGLVGSNSSDTQFVDLMYANVLHRAPDQSGYDYWLGQMQGGITRETVLIGFSESPENQAALVGVIQGGIEYMAG